MSENMLNVQGQGYTIQQLMDITAKTAMNINGVSEQMGVVVGAVNGLRTDVKDLKLRMNTLELNEEVTTTQQETIMSVARKRIVQILGENNFEHQKYFRIFVQKLYGDARHYAGLGSKISRTKKCDYQRCIDFIESWVPSCGCAALKAKADANAAARLEARKLGYLDELKKRKE